MLLKVIYLDKKRYNISNLYDVKLNFKNIRSINAMVFVRSIMS